MIRLLPVRQTSPNRLYENQRHVMKFRRKNIRLHRSRYQGRAWFFVTICCEGRRPIFVDDRESVNVIECLKSVAEKRRFRVHAYCLMPDHFHMLLEGFEPESDLLLFVRHFKHLSIRGYSKRCGAALWQKKFYDHILRLTDSLEAVSWYIWMNPVRKGLCDQPHEYAHSGSLTRDWIRLANPGNQWIPTWRRNLRHERTIGIAT